MVEKDKHINRKAINWEAVNAICTIFLTLSVFIAIYQIYLSKQIATIDFMSKLDDEFNSERIAKARIRTVNLNFTNLDSNEISRCEPLLNFFDKVAYLEGKGMIPLESIDAYWGYWIERYWVLCENAVYNWRKEDPGNGYYEGLEVLFKKLAKLSYPGKGNIGLDSYKNKIKKDLDGFKEEEMQACGFYVNMSESDMNN